ncbi:hypothetical protein J8N05_19530 [Streptomyces sp. BH-SS-21]|uniref:Uncharacterized protein n=1 Tax=Streptomyces liliiviolaceus TaxID=2823109 RepID=A0A940XUG0_9ACTN|nr:hypothetical protein [Streptomyces liliiviolaceus]MBQ0850381.1 hypothetical protein [Streptomyces liliiviolaceus]
MLSKIAVTAATLMALPLAAAPSAAHEARAESLPLTQTVQLLPSAAESRDGYQRTSFKHWADADRDPCNTRSEVLVAESRVASQ